jgi:hypothetical protein
MKLLVVGDSISGACGFLEPQDKIWHHYLKNDGHDVTNLSIAGSSNEKILLRTASAVVKNSYDFVIVQWSGLFRLNLNLDHSIYDNFYNISPGTIDKKYQKMIDCWTKYFLNARAELTNFLDCTIILANLLTLKNIQFIFVKTVDNFLSDLQRSSWKDTSDFFKETVLQYSKYPNFELDLVFTKLSQQYQLSRSVANWLNLESESWQDQIIDFSDDNFHPGELSCKNYYLDLVKTLPKQL